MKGEFYKMEYEAWDEGTDDLSLELEGAYLRLCHQMYRRHGVIPENVSTLARIWRCHPNKARKLLEQLIDAQKIFRCEGGIGNTRVTRELDHRDTISRQRADTGHTGGTRSGVVRRKSLESNDANEAFASTPSKQNEAEESRVDKSIPPVVPRGGRKARLPDDWTLSERDWSHARDKGFSDSQIRAMAEAFANHHRSKGSLMLDWEAAWRTWVGNELKFGAKPIGATIKPGASGLPANVSEDVAREAYMRGSWPDSWGARPGFPGCRIPESIQREWLSLSPQQQERTG